MKYANTTYILTTSSSFDEMFANAKAAIGENPCVGFDLQGVTVIVHEDSILDISKNDWKTAKVMGIGEIFKPLCDVALANEAYLRERSYSGLVNRSVMEVTVYGGHVIKGFVSHEVQLTSRFQVWVREVYGVTDDEAIQMLGERTQYFDAAIASNIYPLIEWHRVPFFGESVKICVEINVAESDIEAIKLKIQEFAKTLIPK